MLFDIIKACHEAGAIDPVTTARYIAPKIGAGVTVEDAIAQHKARRPKSYHDRKENHEQPS